MYEMWFWLILSLVIILVGCDLFTNGIEWVGKKMKLAEGAVGSVLAAVGTCLPETLIAILAIVIGHAHSGDDGIGIGAILGAPMMLSTLAFFVTGAAVIIFSSRGRREMDMSASYTVLGRDLRFFFIVFGLATAASFLQTHLLKVVVAICLLAFYVYYVRQTFADTSGPESHEDVSPLHFHRSSDDPALALAIVQAVAGLGTLIYGAHHFVGSMQDVAHALGMHPMVLSLLLTPVATELPEKFNSVLWVRQRKDTLALGNISGAMVFQSSIPPAIGMLMTNWVLNHHAWVSVIVALLSSGVVWAEMTYRKRVSARSLLMGGLFYLGYLIWILHDIKS